ncbi:MAG: AMP-dependent synthetase [Ruminococcaceae bacterium]|nr:AMP-dependent synthetase [Oscillospiraceae bacterium]
MKYQRRPNLPFDTIRQMVKEADEKYHDSVAYRYKLSKTEIKDVTFGEFKNQCEALGAALCELGYGNTHVACYCENRYEWILSYFTVIMSEGAFVPLDKDLPSEDFKDLFNNSDSKVIFVGKKNLEKLLEVKDKMPLLEKIICFDLDEDQDGVLSFSKLLKHGESLDKTQYNSLQSDLHSLKLLVYTSGTTGVAKGVMLSESNMVNLVYHGLNVAHIYDSGLSILPYTHSYAAVVDILVAFRYGASLAINDQLKAVVNNLKLFKPDYMMIVPAVAELFYTAVNNNVKKQGKEKAFKILIKVSRALRKMGIDLRRKLFSSVYEAFGGNLRQLVCGGAPIRPEIGKFFDDIGIPLTAGYGITECSPLVCVNPMGATNYKSAGKKLGCVEWRIDQPNEEGIGEICVKGKTVMLGYYKNPEKTAEVIKDGWFYTGDYGMITEDDELIITGRKKNLIVLSNGKNIYPEEMENILMSIDEITEIVVRGIKNEHGEEIALSAEVFMEQPIDKEALRTKIDEALKDLPAYKQIKDVIIRTEPFPKTSSRKIKR